jgi:hypothetical protein
VNTISFRCAAVMLLAGAGAAAGAQDCAPTPLFGRRIAAGAQVSHSTLGETGFGALLTGRVAGPLRLDGAYMATRVNDVDRLAQGGRIALSAPVALASFELCPTASIGYSHLSTSTSTTEGRVTTRESRLGTSIGRAFTLAHAARITPFVEPTLVRRRVSWESVDSSWRVSSADAANQTQLWLGVSVATSRSAVVARFRPKRGEEPREIGVGIVTAFGKH